MILERRHWRLEGEPALAIGVDLGGTKLIAGAIDLNGRCSPPRQWDGRFDQYRAAIEAIASLVERVRADCGLRSDAVVPVGVATAAFLDSSRERVIAAPNLGWTQRSVRDDLRERLRAPVVLENDGDAAAWGEFLHGAGRGARCLLTITVGTGVGAGIVRDGALDRGATGLGAELGHVQVEADGPACPCGSRGCLEQYASGTALTQAARAAARARPDAAARLLALAHGDPERISGPLVTAAALEGDVLARDLLADVGTRLGRALGAIVTILDPSLVAVGGGVAAAGDLLLEPLRSALEASVGLPAVRRLPQVRPASLGGLAGAIGAAALARSVASAVSAPSSQGP